MTATTRGVGGQPVGVLADTPALVRDTPPAVRDDQGRHQRGSCDVV